MADNMRLKRTLEFDVTDAPMLMHAMMIAANTAKLCQHPDAERKLRAYQRMFQAFIPPQAMRFEEEAWGELGMALMDATRVTVFIAPKAWEEHRTWWSEGRLAVRIWRAGEDAEPLTFYGDRRHDSYVQKNDIVSVQALVRVLQELAPMGCTVDEMEPQ